MEERSKAKCLVALLLFILSTLLHPFSPHGHSHDVCKGNDIYSHAPNHAMGVANSTDKPANESSAHNSCA